MLIYDMTILDIKNFRSSDNSTLAIIPVGSLEQHGYHLPISTDSIIAERIAREISLQIPSIVLPAIPYGVSFEHLPLFNISINSQVLSTLLTSISVSLIDNGFENIIIINGHHGNVGVLQYLPQNVREVTSKKNLILAVNYWHFLNIPFDHAGHVETSLMLAICPDLVKMELAEKEQDIKQLSNKAKSIFLTGAASIPKITTNGVMGDPTKANKLDGSVMLSNAVTEITRAVNELKDFQVNSDH
jgi:creatinine amidohydrolase